MPTLTSLQLRLAVLGVLVLALAGLGWYAKGVLDERATLRLQNSALTASLANERAVEKTTSIVLSARSASAAAIQKEDTRVQTEIAALRPGAECSLPVDWRVLHDAATGAVPSPAPGADDAALAPADAAQGQR